MNSGGLAIGLPQPQGPAGLRRNARGGGVVLHILKHNSWQPTAFNQDNTKYGPSRRSKRQKTTYVLFFLYPSVKLANGLLTKLAAEG